ncbi:MAG: response regulator [Planctomycetota bacterium]
MRRCKHTVLWVDDDPNVSAAFARRLLRYSIRVVPASDGMQGYWMALTKSPDAIVTDLRMPRWEGEELVDCLKHNATTRAIPTIVLSGYVADFSENFRTDYGIDAVLEKPIALEKLLATLRSCWASGPGSASVESRRTLLQGA